MLVFLVYALLAVSFVGQVMPATDVTQEFRNRDQALIDAIAPGDAKAWDNALAADAVYVDENGEEINRADFLAQLKPLPPGTSGNIRISKYSVRVSGDVATVIHTDDEQENYHGQALTAQYLMTETWQRQAGTWKLLLVHAYAVLKEPKGASLPAAELDAYVGRYSGGSDLTYTIRREGDHLIGQREGRPESSLTVEVRDVFFVSGQLRTRKIFERDNSGQVTGLVDRREGTDLVWKRVP